MDDENISIWGESAGGHLALEAALVNNDLLNIEYRVNSIYSLIVNDKSLIKRELEKPIIK